jgi:hypothetical protein
VAAAQGFEVGVKGGFTFADIPNYAELIDDEGGNPEMRVGAVVGAHLGFTLGRVIGLQTEVLYKQKGLKASAPAGIEEAITLKLDYIEVPVLLRFGAMGRNGLQFLVGPSFNFNTRARVVLEGMFDEDEDVADEFEDFELGLVVGAGYYGSPLIVEGRYEEGLTDIADFQDFGEADTYRNRTFMVLMGFRFGG